MELALLFVKAPRPGDSEVTYSVFESSCHLLLPVYQLPLSVLLKDQQANLLTCLHTIPSMLITVRQAGKIWL